MKSILINLCFHHTYVMQWTYIVYLGQIIYLNSIEINEQINVNFSQVIYFISECYVLYCIVTRAGQNEWKLCQWQLLSFFKDFAFSDVFSLGCFFCCVFFLIGKQYRSASIFKGKRIKNKEKENKWENTSFTIVSENSDFLVSAESIT